MRVRATEKGFIHQGVIVTRNGETVTDVQIQPGDEFEWDGVLGSWMKPLEEESEPVGKKEIMARLDAVGIKYFKGATVEQLTALLPFEA